MNEDKKDLPVIYETAGVVQYQPLKKKNIEELRSADKYRVELLQSMQKGSFESGAHYGSCPGIKQMVFASGINYIMEAFHIYSDARDPVFTYLPMEINGQIVNHFRVVAKVPIYDEITGRILGVGTGVASSLEPKHRYRGDNRQCPKCKRYTIFKDKKKGGYYCWKKKDGCGATFPEGEAAIENQPAAKAENMDPDEVIHTVAAMAIKRAEMGIVLKKTGMGRYLKMPDTVGDVGSRDNYYNSNYQQPPPSQNQYQGEPARKQNTGPKNDGKDKTLGDCRSELFHEMATFYGNPEDMAAFLLEASGNRYTKVEHINNISDLNKIVAAFEKDKKNAGHN